MERGISSYFKAIQFGSIATQSHGLAVMYLLDTNIFLEILLDQEKKSACQEFISKNSDKIAISDFSFHSIAVILFRYKKYNILKDFYSDIISKIQVLNLPKSVFVHLIDNSIKIGLDFDDMYQYSVAKYFNLEIVTMDTDFKKVSDLKVIFL
jgi:predicted nucleic acid-binding protein